jgi:hypothetical protein
MREVDDDTGLEILMRRWHHTTELATAAWAEFLALADALGPCNPRVVMARARWRAAETERNRLMAEIERLEEAEAA